MKGFWRVSRSFLPDSLSHVAVGVLRSESGEHGPGRQTLLQSHGFRVWAKLRALVQIQDSNRDGCRGLTRQVDAADQRDLVLRFHSQHEGTGALVIYGLHRQSEGRQWCPTSRTFSTCNLKHHLIVFLWNMSDSINIVITGIFCSLDVTNRPHWESSTAAAFRSLCENITRQASLELAFYSRVFVCVCMLCTSKPHLDHGEEALVGGGVSGDGEASCGVPGDDAVHGAPGRSVRLVFVGHGQVSHDHVHPVLVNLSEELKEQRLDDSTLHKAVVNITNKQCFATANSSLSRRAECSISENKEHISHKHCSFLSSLFSFTEEDKHIGCFIGFSLLHHLPAANKSSESFSVV